MIPPHLVQAFPAAIRDRGDGYVDRGAIRIVRADRHRLAATASGANEYALTISATVGDIALSCSCPYGQDVGACKHLWALLSVSDDSGDLAAMLDTGGARSRFTFVHAPERDVVRQDTRPPKVNGYAPRIMRDSHSEAAALSAGTPRYDGTAGVDTNRAERSRTVPAWRQLLTQATSEMRTTQDGATAAGANAAPSWPDDRRLVYIVDLEASRRQSGLHLDVGTEKCDRDGEWGAAKKLQQPSELWLQVPDPMDRSIREMLLGATELPAANGAPRAGFNIRERSFGTTLRSICETGRCRIKSTDESLHGQTLRWDDSAPWTFHLRLERDENGLYALTGVVRRDEQEEPVTAIRFVHADGFMIMGDMAARIHFDGMFAFADALREASVMVGEDPTEFLEQVYRLPQPPAMELPPDLVVRESDEAPTPMLHITRGPSSWRQAPSRLALQFRYGSTAVGASAAPMAYDRASNTLFRRQPEIEQAAYARLKALGMREEWNYDTRVTSLVMTLSRVPSAAAQLTAEGWDVEADGVAYRWPGLIRANVRTGIDWFDLHGSVQFGTSSASLASVLDAYNRQEGVVELEDGAIGFIPADELARMGLLFSAGQRVDDAVRFQRSQLALLDILLASMPAVDVDEALARARTELAAFTHIAAEDAPSGFQGVLREYQREGLAWFRFLRRFDLGGCLADDMGLGKTVQVLAMLEERREERAGMSLVVVPRSLVYNWIREAGRFTPALRVLDFSGATRDIDSLDPETVDVVVTTYGTIRRDAAKLRDVKFDYVILDEAQAIKNANTATAKACRLLNASNRLALSGTPIENRIEELWSLFEFLNPGMLGASTQFASAARSSAVDSPVTADDASGQLDLLARALRPVILRRKKSMVARDLPPRVEQTLDVTLEPKQRNFYERLRRRYQASLLKQIDETGLQKSRMHILEALLRLRQAACHPVLADPTKASLPSAKLDALIPALAEIAAEGNKALVFSQFTSFLALVRERLDAEGITYEYLDGRTKQRQEKVDRFQTDSECPVFLISLKAGGHGLNLTSAEYVYLLDPWWNPAVEAQAIDRAHRIGQSRTVIATRLVARDTIESKILQLQDSKRHLADAILTEDKGALASIGRAELELLLS